jgi:hypothetical protein
MLKTLLSVAAAIALLMTYSAATNFSHWPWTSSREISDGQALGFAVGQTKEAAFRNAIDQQQGERITALRLLDAPPTTYDEKFKGFDLKPEDLQRVLPFDRWYVAISDRNAWLELTFEDGRIARIVEKRYRGPTV